MAASEVPARWDIKQSALNISNEVLGYGSYSRVYRAKWYKEDGEMIDVAAKVLLNQDVNPKELTTLHKLSTNPTPNPNIIRFYGAVRSVKDNTTTIVTELASNASLYDYLAKMKSSGKRLSTKRILKWGLEAANAIQHLHDNNVMHRDIKSPNFLIMEDMTLKLCDFGISIPDGKGTKTTHKTRGTTRWMAPEVLLGKISNEGDIFSYGTVIWEMIMCEEPYHECQHDNILLLDILVDKKPLQPLPDDCPKDLKKLVASCRHVNKAARPTIKSIKEILTVLLQQYVQEDTVDNAPIQEKGSDATPEAGNFEVDAASTMAFNPPSNTFGRMTLEDSADVANGPARLDPNNWTQLLRVPDVRDRIRSQIVPSSLVHHLSSIFNLGQEQHVKAVEREKGLIAAADLIIDLLLSCADRKWPAVFMDALEKEESVLVQFLTAEMETFLERQGSGAIQLSSNLTVRNGGTGDLQPPAFAPRQTFNTENSKEIADDLDFEFVARKCKPDDVKSLLRHLNLDVATVEHIRHDHRDLGTVEVTIAVLQKWRLKNGRNATREALLSACRRSGCMEVADKLQVEFEDRRSNEK